MILTLGMIILKDLNRNPRGESAAKNVFIFGGSDIKETAPYGNNAKVISANLSCSPCRGKCEFDKEKCLEQIKPNDVFEGIKEWIK